MLERIQYKNHMNEVIDFGCVDFFASTRELHNYSWTVATQNNKISSFRKTVTKRTLPVTISCFTEQEGTAARNRLMEIAEKDVLAKKPGQIIIGDYYYRCYVTESKKTGFSPSRRKMRAELTVCSDEPCWIRETVHMFRKAGQSSASPFDYPFDYSFDYMPSLQRNDMTNMDFTESNFRMIMYGPCSNPTVYISGHGYGVNCDVAEGEYLTIDSLSKKITRTAVDGAVSNVFNLRRRDSYIFRKIPAGKNIVTWDGNFGVDIVLLEERSEPKWT